VLERGPEFLAKVRISGGGRCNVTHACFDAKRLAEHYPRGGRELIGAFHRFQPEDTMRWFEDHGVALKTEADGRVFPVTDSSATIVDCLVRAAESAGVQLRRRLGVETIAVVEEGRFELTLSDGSRMCCDRLLVAIGGCRGVGARRLIESLGHAIDSPVPSLFTFHVETSWLRGLAGVTLADVEVSLPRARLRTRGSLLVTHHGVSGPAVLALSAHGARVFHDCHYRFDLHVRWLPTLDEDEIRAQLRARRASMPNRLVANAPLGPLPGRLWAELVRVAGIAGDTRWHTFTREGEHALTRILSDTVLAVTGKSLNKEEFVTCGGVRLRDVSFRTLESRVHHGLYFAGEVLDIDGLTGGFNFQAAWTTGWIAGRAMAGVETPSRQRTR
jgi:predicted Rossmann fold flavoprotein